MMTMSGTKRILCQNGKFVSRNWRNHNSHSALSASCPSSSEHHLVGENGLQGAEKNSQSRLHANKARRGSQKKTKNTDGIGKTPRQERKQKRKENRQKEKEKRKKETREEKSPMMKQPRSDRHDKEGQNQQDDGIFHSV